MRTYEAEIEEAIANESTVIAVIVLSNDRYIAT